MNDTTAIKALAKQCLGIVPTATAKDGEIEMLINTAIADLTRLGITPALTNPMHQTAIVQFVKANFGMTSKEEKELSAQSYILLTSSIQMMLYGEQPNE